MMSVRSLLLLAVLAMLLVLVAPSSSSFVAASSSSDALVDESSSSSSSSSSDTAALDVSSSSSSSDESSSSTRADDVSSSSSSSSDESSSSTRADDVSSSSSSSDESSSTGADASSTGADVSSSAVELSSSAGLASSSALAISSSYVVPVPHFNYSSFAALYAEENYMQGPAFIVNMEPVTAFGTCATAAPAVFLADTNFTSVWAASCSYNGTQLTLAFTIFSSTCGTFDNATYINVTAMAQEPTAYSPSLYPVSYAVVADGKESSHGTWYALVQCPTFPEPETSSSDSSIGVVIGGVVIGVIVVFIVIALLYSRRNRKTVDQTGNTTDANQAYSRL